MILDLSFTPQWQRQTHQQSGLRFTTTTRVVLLVICLSLLPIAQASTGDQLPSFQQCLQTCRCDNLPSEYTVLGWSCDANCNYYCQQTITDERELMQLPVVQFYGKWPFRTVVGVQEFWSTVFSLGNLLVNYLSFKVIYREYRKLKRSGTGSDNQRGFGGGKSSTFTEEAFTEEECRILYQQSLILLVVSCIGWGFSSIFHFRDTPFTEVLDYFGAFAIILSNLNIIVVRYFKLYKQGHLWKLTVWQLGLLTVYMYHVIRLAADWDYSYNMNINVVLGLSAMVLWFLHSFTIGQVYKRNFNLIHSTITLVPYETNILKKLHLHDCSSAAAATSGERGSMKRLGSGKLSHWIIPYVPVFNNIILLGGLYLEINDFEPWQRLVDAHSLWHLLTIFPSFIWFDWNVWDVEMAKVTGTL
ncbi:hypothetical protein CANMA_000611 [Candida margitis]|uniref:uncharacterized protein n=1 Tax=Candida margitis TaxID=1775924 RepID=UPI0022262BB0|nr:uncharacterized protein CANMA_000611 [Candida margitis]KAI5970259.1 hypothetical protein CANMA_000611 [Candida margitis]